MFLLLRNGNVFPQARDGLSLKKREGGKVRYGLHSPLPFEHLGVCTSLLGSIPFQLYPSKLFP